jgi:hypothetical protein
LGTKQTTVEFVADCWTEAQKEADKQDKVDGRGSVKL